MQGWLVTTVLKDSYLACHILQSILEAPYKFFTILLLYCSVQLDSISVLFRETVKADSMSSYYHVALQVGLGIISAFIEFKCRAPTHHMSSSTRTDTLISWWMISKVIAALDLSWIWLILFICSFAFRSEKSAILENPVYHRIALLSLPGAALNCVHCWPAELPIQENNNVKESKIQSGRLALYFGHPQQRVLCTSSIF